MLRVLVADDSRVVRQRLAAQLGELEEVKVVGEASGGREAIELLSTLAPDVVIVDLGMPEVDGFAVLHAAKATERPPAVIVLTNYAYAQYREKALAEGADYFLDKSHEFADVTEILGDLAASGGRARPRARVASKRRAEAEGPETTPTHASRQRLSGVLLQSISDLVLVADQDGRIVHVSPSVKTILGYEPDEVLDDGWWQLTRPDPVVRQVIRERTARHARGTEPISADPYQTEVCHKNGEPRWLEWHDASGPDGTVVGVGHDVTDRRRTQETLRLLTEGANAATGDAFFRSIVLNLTRALDMQYALVGELVPDGPGTERVRTIAVANGSDILDNIDYALEGTPCASVAGRRTCAYARDVQSLFPRDVLLRAMGAESYIGTPLFGAAGQPLGILVLLDRKPLRDEGLATTALEFMAARAAAELERRQADRALRASEKKFGLAFMASPSPMAIISFPDGRWVDANESFVKTFGFLLAEARGRTAGELGLWRSHEARDRVVHLLETEGRVQDLEIEVATKTGEVRVGSLSAELLDLDGRPHVLAVLADVTERKGAELALRRSERRFRRLAENAWDVFLLLDESGVIEWGTESVTKVMGYDAEEFAGGRIFEFVHPDDLELVFDRFRAVVATPGHTETMEIRAQHKDGTWRWLEAAGTNLLHDPAVHAIIGNFRDVTERRAAAESIQKSAAALRQSEERFRSAFEDAPIGIALVDIDGRMLRVNRTWCDALGYTEEEMRARSFQDLTHPDDLEASVEALGRLRSGEISTFEQEKRYVHKQGHLIWAILKVSLHLGEDGKPLYFVSQMQDITQRKLAEEALASSEQRFRTVADALNEAVWDLDMTTGRVWWGEGLRRLFGYTPAETGGKVAFWEGRVHPDDRDGVLTETWAAIDRGDPEWAVEYRFRRSDGDYAIVLDRASIMRDESGRAVRLVGALVDISERREAEEALRASEERFRFIARATNEALWDHDLVTGEAWWGEGFGRFFGYAEGELPATDEGWLAQIHPEDRERVRSEMQALVDEGGTEWAGEYRFRRKDGTYATVYDRAFVVRDEAGRPLRKLGAMLDLTDRKTAEEALGRSEERYRTVVEQASDGIFIFDHATGELLDVNPRACTGLGYDCSELLGRRIVELLPAGGPPMRLDRLTVGQSVVDERTLLRKDGTPIQAEISLKLLPDGRVLGIARDVTERKRAEAALRASEAKFAGAFDASPSPMVIMTLQDGIFVEVNASFLHTFGYRRDELIGRPMGEFGIWDDPDDGRAALEKVRRDGSVTNEELEFRTRSGDRRIGLYSAERIELGGEPYLLALINDITERRALEAQLRQAQKLEAVGQLTSGIAHDFNNLLTVILSNADLIEAHLPAELTALRGDVEDLKVAARRGADMIRKLLSFSRRGALAFRPISLGTLLKESAAMLRRVIPEHIDVRLQSDQPVPAVLADPGAVEQILLNLATNARDAMPRGGTLTIDVSETRVEAPRLEAYGLTPLGSFVCLSVADTGVGMDETTRARIFEPFFTTKPPGQGTGLGMAMIYGLVRQHGGFVEVESAAGHGTTVRVFLPATDEAPTDIRAPQASVVRGGTETILVVEDFAVIRRAARRALERHGYRVLLAEDGEEALRILLEEEEQVDLVITDLVMPKVGGQRLFDAVRQAGKTLPFLFTSGYRQDDRPDEAAVLEPGMPFLRKPWTVPELLAAARDVLDRPR